MITFDQVKALREYLFKQKQAGRSIGLVPTMGALHAGHFALISASQKNNDLTVCSIYVNPKQFNEAADLKKYPRSLAQDKAQLKAMSCDVLFCPSDAEMYPQETKLQFDFGALGSLMEGEHRPGHFNGVATVVAKLFHQVKPDRAYFGQKDLQQYVIINQLVQDLSFDLELERIPIVREADGLALSSRNELLTYRQRQEAPQLFQALLLAAQHLERGESRSKTILSVEKLMKNYREIELEYFQIVNSTNLQPLDDTAVEDDVALCIAAHVGEVRLIDNLIIS